MIVLVGPSASGKTEAAKLLYSIYGIKKVITHTTRPMRIGEKDDVDYHFVSKEEFLKLKEKNYFIETTLYNGNYYGTSKSEVSDNKVLIVDPNGVKSILSLNDPRIIIFRLNADSTTRFNRMIIRGDSIENIEQRISKDKDVFSEDALSFKSINIDTEKMTLLEIAKFIYETYQDELANL